MKKGELMLRFHKNDGVPDYKRFLQMHQGYILLDSKVTLAMTYDSEELSSMDDRLNEMIYIGSGGQITSASKRDSVLDYLIDYCGVSRQDLMNKDSLSLSADVLEKLAKYPLACDFTELYIERSSLKDGLDTMRAILSRAETGPDIKGQFGSAAYKIKYNMVMRKTGRFYTSEENVQSIPKKYLKYLTCPPGKFLLSTDFTAFEPSIQFYVLYYDPSLAEGFLRTRDPYEFMYYVTNPNHKEFTKDFRNIWKFPFLQAVYGQNMYKTMQEVKDEVVGKNLHDWLSSNSRRRRYQEEIKKRYIKGEEIVCSTYFGNRIVTERQHSVDKAIRDYSNYPVQGTAHDIVTKYSLTFVDMLNMADITDIQLVISRHDEPIFQFDKKDIRKVAEVFKLCNRIQIDNWRPISCKGLMSYMYGMPFIEIEADPISEGEINEILFTKPPYYFPLRTKVDAFVGMYFVPDNDGSLIGVCYGKSEASTNIFAKVFKDPSNISAVADVIVRTLLIDNPDYDYRITSNIPLAPVLKETTKMIDDEGLFTSIDIEITDSANIDFNLISNILFKAGLNPSKYLPGAYDCGYILTKPYTSMEDKDYDRIHQEEEVVNIG